MFSNHNYLDKLTISFSGICEKTHPVSLVENLSIMLNLVQKLPGHGEFGAKKYLEGIGDPHLLTIDDQIIPHSEMFG